MRVFAALLTLILALNANAAPPEPDELLVVATLVSVAPERAGCGVFFIGTTATYRVAEESLALRGQQIDVVVPCIEMPRAKFNPKAGDLEAFVPGQTHHLAITTQIPDHLTTFDKSPRDRARFYLKAASLKPL